MLGVCVQPAPCNSNCSDCPDLLRAYPAKAPSVISSLQKCFRNIEDPEGKVRGRVLQLLLDAFSMCRPDVVMDCGCGPGAVLVLAFGLLSLQSALIWMMGEYGQLIDEAPYLLEPLIDSITQESDARVRAEVSFPSALFAMCSTSFPLLRLLPPCPCQLLTATTKLFFKRPPEVQQMLGRLFKICLDDSNDPLVHDK